MPDSLQQRSPLAAFRPTSRTVAAGRITTPGVLLGEVPFLGYINLRGNPVDLAFLDAARRSLRIRLSPEPNTVSEGEAVRALWLGPDEWLVITEANAGHDVAIALRKALQGVFSSVTDVSDGQTILHISGPHAVAALRKGCSLDFDPGTFTPGRCAQTLIANVGVLIHCVDPSPSFDLVVRRSFSDYFVRWIQDAATEYGFAVV
jgi:sarcosine oxidase, subunit gamma